MQIICINTPAATATTELARCLREARGQPILLLLSGGSWLAALETWTDTTALSPRVTIGMLDERFSTDSVVNNFAQFADTTFYTQAQTAGVAFIDSRVQPGESHADYTARHDHALHAWRVAHPTGVVMATLGMGADGHTAGLFPGSAALLSSDWVVVDEIPVADNPYPRRTTVTPHFLRTEVTAAVALVTGPNKCTTLARLHASPTDVADLPARLWHHMQSVTVVTDCQIDNK